MPEIKHGTYLLTSHLRHLGGPTKERFQYAPFGAYLKRCLLCEIPRFRDGQQPKLREMILVKLFSGRFVFSNAASVRGKIIRVNFRLRHAAPRRAASIRS